MKNYWLNRKEEVTSFGKKDRRSLAERLWPEVFKDAMVIYILRHGEGTKNEIIKLNEKNEIDVTKIG